MGGKIVKGGGDETWVCFFWGGKNTQKRARKGVVPGKGQSGLGGGKKKEKHLSVTAARSAFE